MTFSKSWPFQQMVWTALEAALPDVPGFSYAPANSPDRYWRIDGLSNVPTDEYKNNSAGRHAFTLHLIDSPDEGTDSLKWVQETLAVAVAALEGLKLDGSAEGLRPETGEARLEARADGINDAHAFVRLRSRLTG